MPLRSARHWIWLYSLPVFCQQQPSVLNSVRQKVLADLNHLPNYTCTETIERSVRSSLSRKFDPLDRYRIEVGYNGGKELFGWAGGDPLAEEDLTRMVAGTVSNGDFALMVRAVFSSPHATFAEAGEEMRDGRSILRYQYQVPAKGSDWILRVPGKETPVPYHGSIRVDRDSLDLIELETTADKIPRPIGFKIVQRTLQFARFRIGSNQFLLPAYAVLRTGDLAGDESKNEVRFSGCREYAVESAVRFDVPDAPVVAGSGVAGGTSPHLPNEFNCELNLNGEIDSDSAAVGDQFTAVLRQAITEDGKTVVPQGAILHGRITRLDVAGGRRYLDLAFLYFDAGGTRIDLHRRRNSFTVEVWNLRDGANPVHGPSSDFNIRTVSSRLSGPLHGDDARLRLPRGYRIFLNSRSAN